MRHIEKKLALGQTAFYLTDLLPFRLLMLFPDQILDVEHDNQSGKDDHHQDDPAPDHGFTNILYTVLSQ